MDKVFYLKYLPSGETQNYFFLFVFGPDQRVLKTYILLSLRNHSGRPKIESELAECKISSIASVPDLLIV